MAERSPVIERRIIQHWLCTRIEKAFRQNKNWTGLCWRMDESYLEINGHCKYHHRAVDKEGTTIDFLLTAERDTKAVRRFLNKAIDCNQSLIKIDKSSANTAAIKQYNRDKRNKSRFVNVSI